MNDFCRDLFEAEGLQLGFPTTLNFFDVYVDPVTREFRPWEDAVKPFSYDPVASYFEMMVPTVDTTRFSSIFSALISQVRQSEQALESSAGRLRPSDAAFVKSIDRRHFYEREDLPERRAALRTPDPFFFVCAPLRAGQARVCHGDDRHGENGDRTELAELSRATGRGRGSERDSGDRQLLGADVIPGHPGSSTPALQIHTSQGSARFVSRMESAALAFEASNSG